MNSQYGGIHGGHGDIFSEHEESSMETHAEDDSSITTEERDESSSENSSEEEIDPWATLINDAASNVQAQYDDILQTLLMEGHDGSEAKQEAFEKFYLHGKRNWVMST